MSTEKRQKRTFTEEFKRDAVALVVDQGYSVAQASRSLGINGNLIYKWRAVLEAKRDGSTLTLGERDELKRLRKEIKRLKMETEILKKASAYFAKEMQ